MIPLGSFHARIDRNEEIARSATPSAAEDLSRVVGRLRSIALEALAAMYRPEPGLFVFRLRLAGGHVVAEGLSPRYTAIALIGLAHEDPHASATILGGAALRDVCARLLKDPALNGLGDVALAWWAAHAAGGPDADATLERLMALEPDTAACPLVEVAWALMALCRASAVRAIAMRDRVAARLTALFNDCS